MATIDQCKFCESDAVGETDPPMCARHQDLASFVDYLTDEEQEITVETVQGLVQRCRANNGDLAIDLADVSELLPSFLDAMPQVKWTVPV